MPIRGFGMLMCFAAAVSGCRSTETVSTSVEPAPICRVVPRQDLPEKAATSRVSVSALPRSEAPSAPEPTVRRLTESIVKPRSTPAPKIPCELLDPARDTDNRLAATRLGLAPGRKRTIRQAQHEDAFVAEPRLLLQAPVDVSDEQAGDPGAAPSIDPQRVPTTVQPDDRYPITLSTALYLAGSSNLQVALAQERVREAYARLDGAKVLWVPNISGGIGFNDHAGQLQNARGQILEVNRQSLFVGGGAGFGRTSLAGGGGPPARMGIDLSPVDVIFEPLAARQLANRASHNASVAFNDTLLSVSLVYLELVRAQAQVAIAQEAVANAQYLARITSEFARTGLGLEADAQRANSDLADRQRELLAGEEQVRVSSAELARLLRLEPGVVLFALESQPVPVELISGQVPLESLIAQGLRTRPEISREHAQVDSTESRIAQERWRPWVPTLHVGVGGGTFGGGPNDSFGDFSGRYDLDALAVWDVRNLGFGNRAQVRERESRYRQACIDYHSTRDRVGQEVAAAYHQSVLRRLQIGFAEEQVEAAADALPLNFNGIRGRELRPIEAQQAIAALSLARNRYVNAVIEYNQAQLALWRSVGHPPDASASVPAQAPPAPADSLTGLNVDSDREPRPNSSSWIASEDQ